MKSLASVLLFSLICSPALAYDLESMMSPSQKILFHFQMKNKYQGKSKSKRKDNSLENCKEKVQWAKKHWLERKDEFGLSESYVVNKKISLEEIENLNVEAKHVYLDFLNKYFPGMANENKLDHSFSYTQMAPHTYDSCKKHYQIGDVDLIKVGDTVCRKAHIIFDEADNYHNIFCADDNSAYIDFNEYSEEDILKRLKPLVKKD